MAAADAFQGACFLLWDAEAAGDAKSLDIVFARLLAGRGSGQQLAEAVQRLGLAELVAQVTKMVQGLLVAGSGSRIILG